MPASTLPTVSLPYKVKDLKGQVFYRLRVLGFSHINHRYEACWFCECECGVILVVKGHRLREHVVRSCGCLIGEVARVRSTKHGMVSTPEYSCWCSMWDRCRNPKHPSYKNYGARGITVCEEWREFLPFYHHVGPRPSPSYSIERLKNDLGYFPGNVVWATRREQNRNRRGNLNITYEGVTMCLEAWSEKLSIKKSTLQYRVHKWGVQKAFTLPVQVQANNE